jgi:predicted  nucleic acid-binding Zn-ribbon protein
MEARVARLEAGLSDTKATLARPEPVLGQVSKDLGQLSEDLTDIKSKDLVELKVAAAKLEGRVSQFPSTVQLLGFVPAVLAIAGVTRFITGP